MPARWPPRPTRPPVSELGEAIHDPATAANGGAAREAEGGTPSRGDAVPRAGGPRRRRRAHARGAARGRAGRLRGRCRCRCGGAPDSGPRRSPTSTSTRCRASRLPARTRPRRGPGRARRGRAHASPTGAGRADRAVRRRVVHVELDPALAEGGVILCSLEDAFRDHGELVAGVVFPASHARPAQARGRQRGVLERRRVPARARRRGRRGAVPDRLRDRRPASPSMRARCGRGPRSEFRVHEYDLAEDFQRTPRRPAVASCGRARALPPGRLALPHGAGAGFRARRGDDVSPSFVAVGRDAYCHWLPALLGGHLVASTSSSRSPSRR